MHLTAFLLNPPIGKSATSTVTYAGVVGAQRALGASGLHLTNLLAVPTRDLTEIATVAAAEETWVAAREQLEQAVDRADCVLLGWGLGGVGGRAGLHFRNQQAWVLGRLLDAGHRSAWTVGGSPRHPSRWRQYTGTQRGIAVGESFEHRLASVLVAVSIEHLLDRAPSRPG